MSLLITPGLDDPDQVPRAVTGLMIELDSLQETEPHSHRKAQLLYIVSGVAHTARSVDHITVGSLYLDPTLAGALSDDCAILFAQPLLRFIAGSSLYPEDDTREARLMAVLLDELQSALLESLHLPMPTDRRLIPRCASLHCHE